MKKIGLPVIVCMTALCLLAGCGMNQSNPPEEIGDEVVIEEEFSEEEIPVLSQSAENVYRPTRMFDFTTGQLLDLLDTELTNQGFFTLATLPAVDNRTEIPEVGEYNIRSIDLGEGALLYLSETLDDQMLFSLMLFGDYNEMDDAVVQLFEQCALSVIQLLSEEPQGILSELNLESSVEREVVAADEYAEFSVSIQDGIEVFVAKPA